MRGFRLLCFASAGHFGSVHSSDGPDLGMPHTRAVGAGLFELRLKSGEGIGRVFYCTLVERRIVMLHQFVKKTEKTPPKELSIARKRMKERKDADA